MAKKEDPYKDAKEQGTSIMEFIIPQKVKAFCSYYAPATEYNSSNSFNEAQLRDFFKAWPTSLGDPLKEYLAMLEQEGFYLQVSLTGELMIFTNIKLNKERLQQNNTV